MTDNASHQRAYYKRMLAKGFAKICVYVKPKDRDKIVDYARALREGYYDNTPKGDNEP